MIGQIILGSWFWLDI